MNFNIVLFTNKLPYELEEWFAYHKIQGCSKFIVYDNLGPMGMPGYLTEWTEEFVTKYNIQRTLLLGSQRQITAYNNYIGVYPNADSWTFILDDDEYLVPFASEVTVSTLLDRFFLRVTVGHKVPWKFFGSSGHEERVLDGLTIENYLWCQQGLDKHHKSMFVPRFASRMLDPHTVEMFGHTPLEFSMHFYIAHYHTKSKEEYREKCDRPRADNGERRNFEESFAAHDINEVFNTDVAYWGKAVRELIKGL